MNMQIAGLAGTTAPSAPPQPGTHEMLVFGLAGEEYAIGIEQVQELRSYEPVTKIANAPAALKGVLNLRGVIVPIVDLRISFGDPAPHYDSSTVVIILNLRRGAVGVAVDSVADVVELEAGQIKPAPRIGANPDSAYVTGLGALGERMLILIDIEHLLAGSANGLAAHKAA